MKNNFIGKVTRRNLVGDTSNMKTNGLGALHNFLEKAAECLYRQEAGEACKLSDFYSSDEIEEIIKWENERVQLEYSNFGR